MPDPAEKNDPKPITADDLKVGRLHIRTFLFTQTERGNMADQLPLELDISTEDLGRLEETIDQQKPAYADRLNQVRATRSS